MLREITSLPGSVPKLALITNRISPSATPGKGFGNTDLNEQRGKPVFLPLHFGSICKMELSTAQVAIEIYIGIVRDGNR
jgi:hypothetical protein